MRDNQGCAGVDGIAIPDFEASLNKNLSLLAKELLELELDEADIVQFEQGFRLLGVIFCRSAIFIPFDRDKRTKRVLYMPPRSI